MTTLFTATEPDVVELVLPWPPSTNTYYRHVILPLKTLFPVLLGIIKSRSVNGAVRKIMGCFRSATLISEAGRKYRSAVIQAVGPVPVENILRGPILCEMKLNPPDARRRDIDNFSKAALDALTEAGVFGDDSQIRKMVTEFGPVVREGRATVKLTTMGV